MEVLMAVTKKCEEDWTILVYQGAGNDEAKPPDEEHFETKAPGFDLYAALSLRGRKKRRWQ